MRKNGWKKKNLLKVLTGLSLLAFTLGACSPAKTEVDAKEPEYRSEGELNVHFLDVGQGLAVLAESDGHYMLYDGGDRNQSSFVVSYLKEQGVDQLDYVVVSHYDADHLSGVIGALETFSVEKILAPDYEHDSKLYQSFVQKVKNSGKTVEYPEVGDQYLLGSSTMTVLAPEEIVDDANQNSVVVKVEQGETSFLLTGDAEHKSEEKMCASGLDLDATVLSLGHHGSAGSTSWEFLQETVPEYAVISCGEDNKYGHPAADTMEKLESMEIDIFRTDKQGTIIASTDGGEIRWNTRPCNDYTPGDEDDRGTIPDRDEEISEDEEMVWLPASGKKYHNKPDCGRMNPDKAREISQEEAQAQGFVPCEICFP